ncbi:hypothetical protein MKW98_016735 [Papaver atlanticum]|uniref:Uncharacterized protein n=1 Tax=Papaver atlanticum TaxID=357466 RepID=A0AAD4TK19_9MAGN|nr:hypothetical protein MKW98_016735 [Papaver atlanticum]
MCKDVMRFAVHTSKCCFQSFCDGCVDPNKTIRDTIDRYIESGNTSSGNTKIPAPSPCTSKTEKIPSCLKAEISDGNRMVSNGLLQQAHENGQSESTSSKVINNAAMGQQDVQQKDPASANKKMKKPIFTVDGKPLSDGDLFWGTSQAIGADYCQMPFGTSAYNNPYWNGMQLGIDGFMAPYNGYMGYAAGYAFPCALSQTKKRSRVTPCHGNDWGEDDGERNYKKKQSWHTSSVSCHAK